MKSSRILLSLLTGFALLPAVARAQTPAGLAIQTNRFYGNQGRTLVEGAVEIPYTLMAFTQDGDVLRAKAKVEVMIDGQDGEQVYRTEQEVTPEAISQAMAASDRVSSIETFAIYAPPGKYTARARVTDLNNQKSFEVSEPLVVPDQAPAFSDILLSNHVQKDVRLQEGAYLPYLIGTTMFNPNPRSVFHQDSPLLYFYYEVNPEALPGDHQDDSLVLHMTIDRPDGGTVKDLGDRTIKLGEERNFDLGAFNIAGLVPGRYRLQLTCDACSSAVETGADFEVQRPAERLAFMQPANGGAQGGSGAPAVKYYAKLSPAQVDSVVGVMDMLFTTSQKQLLGTLSPEGKVRFLNRFWDSLDSDPQTPENEFKQLFERRVAYADQFFGTLQRVGHETDRGLIYVLYGEPTEKIDRPVEATVGPYVIWNYSSQGQTFAFGDFSKNGQYKLIYSTDPNHPGDPSIQSLVDNTSDTSSPSFLRTARGYDKVILDIRENRVTRGFAQ